MWLFFQLPPGLLQKQHGVHNVAQRGESSVGREYIRYNLIFNHVVKKRKAY